MLAAQTIWYTSPVPKYLMLIIWSFIILSLSQKPYKLSNPITILGKIHYILVVIGTISSSTCCMWIWLCKLLGNLLWLCGSMTRCCYNMHEKYSESLMQLSFPLSYCCMFFLQIGKHGMIIEFTDPDYITRRSATYLPEVAAHEGNSFQPITSTLFRKSGAIWPKSYGCF